MTNTTLIQEEPVAVGEAFAPGRPVAEVVTAEAIAQALDPQLVAQLAAQARAQGLQLLGRGGVLQQLTKRFLEAALEAEMDDHLGYSKHDAAGRNRANSRNGKRGKTLLTEVGPVSTREYCPGLTNTSGTPGLFLVIDRQHVHRRVASRVRTSRDRVPRRPHRSTRRFGGWPGCLGDHRGVKRRPRRKP